MDTLTNCSTVSCPFCDAVAGEPCRSAVTGEIQSTYHVSRVTRYKAFISPQTSDKDLLDTLDLKVKHEDLQCRWFEISCDMKGVTVHIYPERPATFQTFRQALEYIHAKEAIWFRKDAAEKAQEATSES